MKVPQNIKQNILNCARLYEKAAINENVIREWLYSKNIGSGIVIDMLIDCVLEGNCPEEFINFLESEDDLSGNCEECL